MVRSPSLSGRQVRLALIAATLSIASATLWRMRQKGDREQGSTQVAVITKLHSQKPLELSVPESMVWGTERDRSVVQETADGFRVFSASGDRRRVSIEASVELPASDRAPAGAFPEEKVLNGRHLHYRIEESEGGSGGTQYDLVAWEKTSVGYLRYRQGDVVEEPAKPRFDVLWRVVEGTRVQDRGSK